MNAYAHGGALSNSVCIVPGHVGMLVWNHRNYPRLPYGMLNRQFCYAFTLDITIMNAILTVLCVVHYCTNVDAYSHTLACCWTMTVNCNINAPVRCPICI